MLRPAVDIFKNDQELLFVAELPGLQKSDINITVEARKLVINGKLDDEKEAFQRSFRLPTGLNLDEINAELNDGLLKLHLPFAAAEKVRQIAVN